MNYLEKIAVPAEDSFNIGLASANNARMLELFGHPVKDGAYRPDGNCTPANNPKFAGRLATRDVGPFKVTGLKPALTSLTVIFARVKNELPDLYAILGNDGMHCARFTKIKQKDGSIKIGPNISNHSWGTAIDMTLAGHLDPQGDGTVLRGLLVLSAFFNAAGWYWGAAFPTEDAMHFEVSRGLLAQWKKVGKI